MEQDWHTLMEYGNRTSSFMSMYPGLEHIHIEKGQARGIHFRNHIVLANEPLCNEEARADEILKLKHSHNKNISLFPIGEKLAGMLKERGFSVWQIGSEPIFDLKAYFQADPLDFLPLGRTLKRRGAIIEEIDVSGLEIYRESLQRIHEEWKQGKVFELGFLNQVDPFFKFDLKRCFILKVRDEIQAFMTAVPLFYRGEILGYYFNDIIRSAKARAGTNELLIVESMRALLKEGVSEVRLGMAPLSRLKKNGWASSFLTFLFEHHTLGYNFKGHYQFKNKLNPSRWDDLYLASSENGFLQSLKYAIEAHFPKGLWHLGQTILEKAWGGYLEIRQGARDMMIIEKGEERFVTSLMDTVGRMRWTLAFMSLFIMLHILKAHHSYFTDLFSQSAYTPGSVTVKGLFLAPLFHNHLFHLFGDQLCFFLFGAYIEIVLGVRHFMALTLAGLFLSNPLTHGLMDLVLPCWPDLYQNHFLFQKDYGSSNAVFTFVGGMGGVLKNNGWLLIPFLIYSIYIAFSLESFLAAHHVVAMVMGYFMVLSAAARVNFHRKR